jgi:hypothetical protein
MYAENSTKVGNCLPINMVAYRRIFECVNDTVWLVCMVIMMDNTLNLGAENRRLRPTITSLSKSLLPLSVAAHSLMNTA